MTSSTPKPREHREEGFDHQHGPVRQPRPDHPDLAGHRRPCRGSSWPSASPATCRWSARPWTPSWPSSTPKSAAPWSPMAASGSGSEVVAKQMAAEAAAAPAAADRLAYNASTGKAVQGGGDLVDDLKDNRVKLEEVKADELPAEMKNLTKEQQAAYLKAPRPRNARKSRPGSPSWSSSARHTSTRRCARRPARAALTNRCKSSSPSRPSARGSSTPPATNKHRRPGGRRGRPPGTYLPTHGIGADRLSAPFFPWQAGWRPTPP